MAETIDLEVVTPERPLVREEVESVEAPGKAGYLGILPGHAAFVGQLGTGVLGYVSAGKRRCLAVSGGFIEVAEGHVRVLADVAERAEEIDVDRAKAALKRAQEEVAKAPTGSGEESAAAAASLERATARIAAAERR
jgi:F-type H+-transporting ATPase subunit epsilon